MLISQIVVLPLQQSDQSRKQANSIKYQPNNTALELEDDLSFFSRETRSYHHFT